jgi:hypothetical protein
MHVRLGGEGIVCPHDTLRQYVGLRLGKHLDEIIADRFDE